MRGQGGEGEGWQEAERCRYSPLGFANMWSVRLFEFHGRGRVRNKAGRLAFAWSQPRRACGAKWSGRSILRRFRGTPSARTLVPPTLGGMPAGVRRRAAVQTAGAGSQRQLCLSGAALRQKGRGQAHDLRRLHASGWAIQTRASRRLHPRTFAQRPG